MDTMSGSEAAAKLGTSIPRVVRAAERLGMRRSPGRLSLTPDEFGALRDELGATPAIDGLSRTEVKALGALRRSPFGVVSARAVAARGGISPTAASRALRALESRGLVFRKPAVVPLGRARQVEPWHANVRDPRWERIGAELSAVRPPRRRRSAGDNRRRVPHRLGHIFWNVDPAQLDLERSGPFIARRLLRSEDPEGLAWGAANLKPSDWREAALARGLDAKTRAMAENLARRGS